MKELEAKTGKKVVTSLNSKSVLPESKKVKRTRWRSYFIK
jgi:hypothetical protein